MVDCYWLRDLIYSFDWNKIIFFVLKENNKCLEIYNLETFIFIEYEVIFSKIVILIGVV